MIPLQISYRGMTSSPALDTLIQDELQALERFTGNISRCHVVVSQPHRHHRKGRPFHVRLELKMPRHELIVLDHDERGTREHESAQLAIRDAFEAAGRRVHDMLERDRTFEHIAARATQ